MNERLRELDRRLGKLEGTVTGCRRDIDHDVRVLHSRLTRLEIKVAWFAGAFSLVGGILGGIITTLVSHMLRG